MHAETSYLLVTDVFKRVARYEGNLRNICIERII